MKKYEVLYEGKTIGQVKGADYQDCLQKASALVKQRYGEKADLSKMRITDENPSYFADNDSD